MARKKEIETAFFEKDAVFQGLFRTQDVADELSGVLRWDGDKPVLTVIFRSPVVYPEKSPSELGSKPIDHVDL